MSIKKEDIARVKGMGFLLNRGTEKFSGRVVAPGSVFTAEQVKALAECAERFGNGTVAFTVRGNRGHSLRKHRTGARIFAAGGAGIRRHRRESAARGGLQGNDLRLWQL